MKIAISAFLNTAIFFVEISRRQIQDILEYFSAIDTTTDEDIQEVGEDLATDLGRAMETKIRVSQVKARD